ncbi:NADH-dependent alcohol dehydrogenase [Brenneria roseae subsp. americana]|uniref:NADH-dependent alcohol dehydrogenase n=1 Tax=Brenneria roseae subsp. americana TaxID=1508507 RepID=A0A2U1TQM7_9GAMM|nr:iron-containing alcohol dehydrogenase [Brenneria roseae]PWC11707.1 NADH-dependent alcohol dehydrogenase [Brenneria roseae subsp. americana]
MINFEYHNPTKVIFGKNSESNVGAEIHARGFKKVLIHFGGIFLYENGVLDRVHESLAAYGIEYIDFDGVVPNPRLALAQKGVELCKAEGVDFILAIGGGSAIDSSKAIAYGLVNDFNLEDLFLGKATTSSIAPIGCISTIAATGSETSNSTVVTITNSLGESFKRSYNHDCARPLFAIINPELTYSVPTYHTASGGADIMFHTMERYFTRTKNVELTDRISEGLLVTVKNEVEKVLKKPDDYNARANLAWAGSISHNGLTGTGRESDFPAHKIAQELSAVYDVIHGASLTAIWSTWSRYVYKTDIPRFAQFATNVFGILPNYHDLEETALLGIEAWDEWCKKIGMPVTLSELGVYPTDTEIEYMAENAVATGNGSIGKFFKELTKEDIINIYYNAK